MAKACQLSNFVINKWLKQKHILSVTAVTAIIKSYFVSCNNCIYNFGFFKLVTFMFPLHGLYLYWIAYTFDPVKIATF